MYLYNIIVNLNAGTYHYITTVVVTFMALSDNAQMKMNRA